SGGPFRVFHPPFPLPSPSPHHSSPSSPSPSPSPFGYNPYSLVSLRVLSLPLSSATLPNQQLLAALIRAGRRGCVRGSGGAEVAEIEAAVAVLAEAMRSKQMKARRCSLRCGGWKRGRWAQRRAALAALGGVAC
ncbi:unnamed protein product, partial [Closterium sp. Naga37s-1]